MKYQNMYVINKKFKNWGCILLAIIIVCITILPFYWAFSLSLRRPIEALTVKGIPVPFLQYKPTLKNWKKELAVDTTQKTLMNSTIIAIGTALFSLVLGTPAAYAIARFRFHRPKNEDISVWFLSQRILPPVVTVFPFFLIIRFMGLLDTRLALILVNTTFNLPIVIIIMRQAFIDVPIELEEAALVDGANYFNVFWRVSLRITTPSMVAVTLIVVAFTWNEFLFALIISTLRAQTISVHMSGVISTRGVEFWFLAVRTLIAITPPVLLAILAQRYIVQGLSFGGVKG